MKTIENLLAEYKIRFRDTERIKEEGYPFELSSLSKDRGLQALIEPDRIINENGKVYGFSGRLKTEWATADLKEAPEGWVVEKQEEHPMWWSFLEHYDLTDYNDRYYWMDDYSQINFAENILKLKGESVQFLTLDQWAEFFLPKYKVGDKVITKGYSAKYDGKVLTIDRIERDSCGTFCYFEEAELVSYNFEIRRIARHATDEEIAALKVDFSILNDEDWFYVETERNKWIAKGNIVSENGADGIHYILNYGRIFRDKYRLIEREYVILLRKATPEELAPLFEKYPELAPPEVGDWGILYDDIQEEIEWIKEGEIRINVLSKVRNPSISDYPYVSDDAGWKHFHKLDLTKNMQQQINKFLKKQEE